MRALRIASVSALVLAASLSCGDDDTKDGTTPDPAPAPAPPPDRYGAVPTSKTVDIVGLTAPVDVVRDAYGMVHIHARTIEDALRVQGYQIARDRTLQLELVRRTATGRMAELYGDLLISLVDSDIAMRAIGLARTAQAMLEQLTPEERRQLEAYADGVSQFNARAAAGEEELPAAMLGLPLSAFQPWTAVDVIAVARLQAMMLGYTADGEIADTDFIEAAREKLVAGSANADLAKRAGFLVDIMRFAPIERAKPLDGFPNDVAHTMTGGKTPGRTPARPTIPVAEHRVSRAALAAARSFSQGVDAARRLVGDKKNGFTGSNNWVVGPSRTTTGHAMLASDPHLSLSAPSVFWLVQVSVDAEKEADRADFAGLAFPGLPGIILGFNKNVAWGATTADYDVTDVYEETLTPDSSGVVFRGQTVPFQKVHETIAIAGREPLEYDVLVVPHHGPIVPTIANHEVVPPSGGKALSVKWTGHAATHDITAILGVLKAKSVDDARATMRSFAIGAQNWVFADTSGDIFYTSQSNIPKRDRAAFTWDPATFTGNIPCFVLPGDGSAEWTGAMLEEAYVPHAKNPAKGWLATANTDQVGTTFDNDPTNDTLPNGEPMYMGAWHDVGFRLARIQQRIEATPKISLDDLANIQSDVRSAAGAKLTASILTALDHAAAEAGTPGARPNLAALVATDRYKAAPLAELKTLLGRWGSEFDYRAASGMKHEDNSPSPDESDALASRATSIFNVWLTRMFHATFDDEIAAVGAGFPFDPRRALLDLMLPEPSTLKTFDAATSDSILFDDLNTPSITESRDERVVTSLLDAIDFLRGRLGQDSAQWQWGRLHTIRFQSLFPLWKGLSIPADPDPVFPIGFPRAGDGYNVDVAGYAMPAALDSSATFSYTHGPTQRFVIDMDPAGPVARNVLPGGNVWDPNNPHFRDEAERWRKNENRPVPFAAADVVRAAEGRTVYRSR